MKYREMEIGTPVVIRKKKMREEWGPCFVVDKRIHGIITVQEDRPDGHRHYICAHRLGPVGEVRWA